MTLPCLPPPRLPDAKKLRDELALHRHRCAMVCGANPHKPLYELAVARLEDSLDRLEARGETDACAKKDVRKALAASNLAHRAAILEQLMFDSGADRRWGDITLPFGYAPAANLDQIGKGHVLRQGHGGKSVGELQELLTRHGYHVEIDQLFGPKTRAAVEAFQRRVGLKLYGIVGPETLARLRAC